MSTLTAKRVELSLNDGKWRSNSRESRAIGRAVTIAKRQQRRRNRATVRNGMSDTLASFEPTREHMTDRKRCPFCDTPLWFCPC